MSAELQHPLLGPIRGRVADGVVQYLGLKYATLKDRLAASEVCVEYVGQVLDATKFGYGGSRESAALQPALTRVQTICRVAPGRM